MKSVTNNEEDVLKKSKEQHLDTVANEFQCDVCIIKFETNVLLLSHTENVHKAETVMEYNCSKCKFVSKTETGMRRHENLFCDLCEICINGNIE